MSDDLISRQALLEWLEVVLLTDDGGVDINDLEDFVKRIPSAQPETIRCKDCKYRGETEDGEYNPEDIVCAYWMSDGLSETDYCSYAERRTEDGFNKR